MKYFSLLYIGIACLLSSYQLSAQASPEVYKVIKGNTGQSYLLAQAATGGVLYTDVYFRIGTIYELDSFSGISVMITRIIDAHIASALRGRRIAYYSTTEPEQLGFHFESSPADFDFILSIIDDKIIRAKFDAEGVDEAKAEVRADIDSIRHSDRGSADIRIRRTLWGRDYKKLNVYGDKASYTHIAPEQLRAFHYKFFLPLNNMIVLTGAFSELDAVNKMQAAFRDFRTHEFNPELIRRIIEFKPIVNTIQIVAQSTDTPLATITSQNPGARQDRSATYCAYLLTQLVNDRNGRIAASMRAADIHGLRAAFDCSNFDGTLTLSAQVVSQNYITVFAAMDSLIGSFSHRDYFQPAELEAASRAITAEFKAFRSRTHSYMTQVAKYRFSNDENYFSSLADSIQYVTTTDMARYISTYYVGHAGVKCLYADHDSLLSAPAGERYYPVDDSIGDVVFTYPLNITDIDSTAGRDDLQRLLQWLRTNPDMHVQINGFADRGEYTKSYDTTVTHFIKATPTFRKAMPDAIRVGYLRIEMMRAMKIAKALYEAGISEDRISGTSMLLTSETPEEADANRKCTVTLEKIKPRVSLYEYHFGRKKDDNPIPAADPK